MLSTPRGTMKPLASFRSLFYRCCFFALLLVQPMVFALDEIEPNENPVTAQDLGNKHGLTTVVGSLDIANDVDFFELHTINEQWGFVAVLDTSASTTSTAATLSVYASDGTTLLQQDQGGWANGSVLAWQHFQGIADTSIYIKVESANSASTISEYSLGIYIIPIGYEEETEPNDAWETGNILAKTNLGIISEDADTDCYRLSGNENESLIVALNADPENDGSTADFVLSLYDASGSLLTSSDHNGPGRNEFIDSLPISHAIYSFCVTAKSGAGSTASYKAGALINETTYIPTWDLQPEWLNPGLGGIAVPGDILAFRLSVTNTSLLPIPADILVGVYRLPSCLAFEDTSNFDEVKPDSAYKSFIDELAPSASHRVDFSTRALSECSDELHQSTSFVYYSLGVGGDTSFTVATNQCEAVTLQIEGPTYSGDGTTYYSSETGIETAPSSMSPITIESPHKLVLEAPSFKVKDGDEFVVEPGALLRVYGKTVTCPEATLVP